MPATLSRKRRIDAVQVTPEKRRRVSAGIAHDSPQESLQVKVRRERDEVPGPWESHQPALHWIEGIFCSAHIRFEQGQLAHDAEIARCNSLFIEREKIRHNFQTHMELRSKDTALLAETVFDETGCLKPEFTQCALKSGSGLWNYELNDGDILVIGKSEVLLDPRYGNIAPTLIKRMLYEASRLRGRSFFAFAWTAIPHDGDCAQAMHVVDFEGKAIKDCRNNPETVNTLEAFWRANGFRRVGMTQWFAWSSEMNHPAHRCSPSLDFNLSACHFFSERNQHSLLHVEVLKGMPDEDCCELFQLMPRNFSPDDLRRIDANGNTLFHLAALSSKPYFISWLKANCPPEVQMWRNFDRQTPLEALLSARAATRKRLEEHPEFIFEGHDDASVDCQLQLCSFLYTTPEIFQRLKFDCSCTHCLGGFLSPRTQLKLIASAPQHLDIHYGDDDYGKWETLMQWSFPKLGDFSPGVKQKIVELWVLCMQQVALVLAKGGLPVAESVYQSLITHWNFCESQTMAELILDSEVMESAILAVISVASSSNSPAGLGKLSKECIRIIQETPECRNDDDWALVRRQLLFKRGLEP
ncbi:hypothetical protein EV356DRAFT_502156 [Viridothelium virens]|uniref:Ankyrin n=1 Tax=Viridothelium virens TaxID=1048519 RepID=A0A6A6HM12_VIRVR|nr:hypothetical protein EV356DRAFT_502156 [Viridothelium virens]